MVARARADKCTHAHRDQPPRGRGVKRRDGAGRTGAGCTSISSLLSRFAHPAQFGSDCLPEGRTDHGAVVLPARRLAGGKITAAKVGPAVAAPEAEWRKSGVGGKKRKRNVLTNAKEEQSRKEEETR